MDRNSCECRECGALTGPGITQCPECVRLQLLRDARQKIGSIRLKNVELNEEIARLKAEKKVAALAALVEEAYEEGWQDKCAWYGSDSRIELRKIMEFEDEEGEG